MQYLVSLIALFLLLFPISASAEGLEPAAIEALMETQKVLTDPVKRADALQADPKAQQANRAAEALAGSPENTQRMYELAADLMATLVKQTNGDTDTMEKMMERAKSHPEEFANTFSESQRAQLREIANHTPGNGPHPPLP